MISGPASEVSLAGKWAGWGELTKEKNIEKKVSEAREFWVSSFAKGAWTGHGLMKKTRPAFNRGLDWPEHAGAAVPGPWDNLPGSEWALPNPNMWSGGVKVTDEENRSTGHL